MTSYKRKFGYIITVKARVPSLIIIPMSVFNTFYDKHVDRKHLSEKNTILVKENIITGKWNKEPSEKDVARLLDKTLDNINIKKGEIRYTIPENLFFHFGLREMNSKDEFTSDVEEGKFVINSEKYEGPKTLIFELKKINNISSQDETDLREEYKLLKNQGDTKLFLVTHFHVAISK